MPAIPIDSHYVDSLLQTVSEVKDICSQSPPNNAFEWFSLIASIATIIGFGITIYQILKIKSTNEAIQESVSEYSGRIDGCLTLITITDAIRLAEMVINLIDNRHYREAIVRMQDLNKAAIELKARYTKLNNLQMKLPSEMEHLKDLDECDRNNAKSEFKISTTRFLIQRLHDNLKQIETDIKLKAIKEKQ